MRANLRQFQPASNPLPRIFSRLRVEMEELTRAAEHQQSVNAMTAKKRDLALQILIDEQPACRRMRADEKIAVLQFFTDGVG